MRSSTSTGWVSVLGERTTMTPLHRPRAVRGTPRYDFRLSSEIWASRRKPWVLGPSATFKLSRVWAIIPVSPSPISRRTSARMEPDEVATMDSALLSGSTKYRLHWSPPKWSEIKRTTWVAISPMPAARETIRAKSESNARLREGESIKPYRSAPIPTREFVHPTPGSLPQRWQRPSERRVAGPSHDQALRSSRRPRGHQRLSCPTPWEHAPPAQPHGATLRQEAHRASRASQPRGPRAGKSIPGWARGQFPSRRAIRPRSPKVQKSVALPKSVEGGPGRCSPHRRSHSPRSPAQRRRWPSRPRRRRTAY